MRLDSSSFLLRILLSVVLCAVAMVRAAGAEQVNLDEITDRLAADITRADLKSVAVTDFLGTDGQKLDLGWYLAAKLSDDLLGQAKNFRLLSRAERSDTKLSADELASTETLKRIGGIWGVEGIVTGAVEISTEHYQVTVSLRRISDGTVIVTESQPLSHSRILDLLSPAGVDAEAANPQRPGVAGVRVPACAYCPVPGYSEAALKARVQSATVVLMVTISTKGSADKISVMKSPGYGLAEKAVETVSGWKFLPASGANGAPVPMAVPIEVTFHSSRT